MARLLFSVVAVGVDVVNRIHWGRSERRRGGGEGAAPAAVGVPQPRPVRRERSLDGRRLSRRSLLVTGPGDGRRGRLGFNLAQFQFENSNRA